jgi:hypothetical protein
LAREPAPRIATSQVQGSRGERVIEPSSRQRLEASSHPAPRLTHARDPADERGDGSCQGQTAILVAPGPSLADSLPALATRRGGVLERAAVLQPAARPRGAAPDVDASNRWSCFADLASGARGSACRETLRLLAAQAQ